MKYPNAARGIKKIYIAEILCILGSVMAIGIAIMVGANRIDTGIDGQAAAQALQSAGIAVPFTILGVMMMLLMVLSYILNLSGIVNASKDDEGFKLALWTLLASIVFGIAAALLESSNAKVANWLKVPSTLLEMVVMIYVLEGINNMAKGLGNKEVADMSAQCRTWLISALILSAVAEALVALGTAGTALHTTSGVVAALLQIVAYVVYLRVLNKARLMQ